MTIELTPNQARALELVLNPLLINGVATIAWLAKHSRRDMVNYRTALEQVADALTVSSKQP